MIRLRRGAAEVMPAKKRAAGGRDANTPAQSDSGSAGTQINEAVTRHGRAQHRQRGARTTWRAAVHCAAEPAFRYHSRICSPFHNSTPGFLQIVSKMLRCGTDRAGGPRLILAGAPRPSIPLGKSTGRLTITATINGKKARCLPSLRVRNGSQNTVLYVPTKGGIALKMENRN